VTSQIIKEQGSRKRQKGGGVASPPAGLWYYSIGERERGQRDRSIESTRPLAALSSVSAGIKPDQPICSGLIRSFDKSLTDLPERAVRSNADGPNRGDALNAPRGCADLVAHRFWRVAAKQVDAVERRILNNRSDFVSDIAVPRYPIGIDSSVTALATLRGHRCGGHRACHQRKKKRRGFPRRLLVGVRRYQRRS
jgi:hypothetical protein